jgi:hypothetical protein
VDAVDITGDVEQGRAPGGHGRLRDRPAPGTDRAGLVRYLIAATLARTADGGAAVGLLLLAVSPAARLHHGAAVGGLLAAGLMAPHLLGPWLGRRMDQVADGRRVLAGSFCCYAIALSAAAVMLGRAPLLVPGALVCLAGANGPLLTGGLSSRLAALAGPSEPAQRRAQGWDAVSYGIGSTVGPAIVAAIAALASPLIAVASLGGAALAAGALTMTLPRSRTGSSAARSSLTAWAALRFMAASGPLRRVTAATALTALSTGGLPIIAIALGFELTSRPGNGAVLVTAYGLGTLTGSLIVTAFPLRGEPETLVVRHTAMMALSLGLCAVAPTYLLAVPAFAVAGANSAAMFTATLAARSRYAAPSARAQVFVTMAGLKVAMASAGVVVAGAMIGIGARPLLGISAGVVLLAATGVMLDRYRTGTGTGTN